MRNAAAISLLGAAFSVAVVGGCSPSEPQTSESETSGHPSQTTSLTNQEMAEQDPFGLAVAPLTDSKRKELAIRVGLRGVLIAYVRPGFAADVGGLRSGDVIEHIRWRSATSVTEYQDKVGGLTKADQVIVGYWRHTPSSGWARQTVILPAWGRGLSTAARESSAKVPPEYTRVSFSDLQPTDEALHPVSPRALELNGKKVFIKGYVYPGDQQYDITHFVMVRDLGTCCFGDQPKLTHMIEVRLQDPLAVDYGLRKRQLGGILRVSTSLKPIDKLRGGAGVFFQLDADYLDGRFASCDDD